MSKETASFHPEGEQQHSQGPVNPAPDSGGGIPGEQAPYGGGINKPETHPPQSRERATDDQGVERESFYRSRRHVPLSDVYREIEPMDQRLLEKIEHVESGNAMEVREKEVFNHEEYLKYRRLRRRIEGALERGAWERWSPEEQTWIRDETGTGGGITKLGEAFRTEGSITKPDPSDEST